MRIINYRLDQICGLVNINNSSQYEQIINHMKTTIFPLVFILKYAPQQKLLVYLTIFNILLTSFSLMKLNFIQNLSDEVLRENYELKSQIQQVRHQLNDYETQMIAVISSIAPNKNICIHPSELLQEFIATIKQELIVYQSLKLHSQLLRNQYDNLQTEVIKLNRSLTQKSIEADSQNQQLLLQLKKVQEREAQLQSQVQVLQQCNQTSIKEFNELKIQKLKVQEAKRRQLEQIRQNQNSEIINFREKNEKEHMKKEKELKKELQMRDKAIKEMSKSIAELSNSKNIEKSQAVLSDIFKSFQSFEDLSSANKQLKDQNQSLREETKDLYNRLIAIQANLQEAKSAEYELQNRLERFGLEKQQIENKLVVKIGQVNKSQKDKEVMQKYYDQKWNSQYKRVKIKLQATYSLRISELEQQSKLRMVAIENELRIMSQENKYFNQRNSELQTRFANDQRDKESLNARLVELDNHYRDFRKLHIQNGLMFKQELSAMKIYHEEENLKLKDIIRNKQAGLKEEAEKLINCRIKHFKEVAELEEMYQQQISKQTKEYKEEIAKMALKHTQDVSKLKQQFYRQMDHAQLLRKDIQTEFQTLLEGERNNGNIALIKKQEEMAKLNKKWIERYQELQNLYGVTRRKNEQEIVSCRDQISKLLQNQFNLHRLKESLQQTIQKFEQQKSKQKEKLQECVRIKTEKESIINLQERQINHCKNQVVVLLSNRKLWRNQLLQVERQFRNEFDEAKKVNEKQINLYKQRIMELEDIKRKNVLNQKTFQKLQTLQNERSVVKSQIHIKQAQNIILHQVKDYYETKLKEAEGRIGRGDLRHHHHAILARKLKKNRITTNESISQRLFQPPQEAFSDKKRYSNSINKNYNLSLSKTKFQEGFQKGNVRVQTLSAFK